MLLLVLGRVEKISEDNDARDRCSRFFPSLKPQCDLILGSGQVFHATSLQVFAESKKVILPDSDFLHDDNFMQLRLKQKTFFSSFFSGYYFWCALVKPESTQSIPAY